MMSFKALTFVFLVSVLGANLARAEDQPLPPAEISGAIRVEPMKVVLAARRRPHSLIVTGQTANGLSVDLTSQAVFASADEKVASVDTLGWVHAVSAGSTTINVTVAGQTVKVEVESAPGAADRPHSFVHEVMPVLSRGGCNSGACHGYSLGKNGFRLSLRGADAAQDYDSITKEFLGRRINSHHPPASLLVAKPLGDVPHQGGVRFDRGSLSHELLSRWIAEGAQSDLEDPVKLTDVRIYPEKVVLRAPMQHQLQLVAIYSDGSRRDVTRLGVFTANSARIAAVDDDGLVSASELGETAVVARFERKFAVTGVIVQKPVSGFQPTPVPQDHYIDRLVVEKLNSLNITPSGLADDAQFLRRVSIDLVGVQPKPEEVRAFVADPDPAKRAKLVEALFARPEFVDHWSLKWGDLLQNSRLHLNEPAVYALREWIRSAVASNMPLDRFARELLTSRGSMLDDPASGYFVVSKDANDTAERATQVFCGVRMLCAKCHPHPMENWTQADYFGLSSFFNQVGVKQDPLQARDGRARVVTLNLPAGFAVNPRTGQPQPPRFLGAGEPAVAANADRRVVYAQWLTAADNPHFARGLVNRVWSYLFHRGIIDPVDDIRTTNPPINPQLLDALTKDFVEHKFDLRHLLRTIVRSQTYQRSSVPTESNRFDDQNFSHAIPRRLTAEALLDSLVQATGIPEGFGGVPGGFTAAQLPDAVENDFLNLFGKPQRMEACECERDDGSNMLQSLHFINGKSILGRVTNPGGRVTQLFNQHQAQKLPPEKLVEELYLWTLARLPSDKEFTLSLEFLSSYEEAKRLEAVQDLAWALLNSRDFLLVH